MFQLCPEHCSACVACFPAVFPPPNDNLIHIKITASVYTYLLRAAYQQSRRVQCSLIVCSFIKKFSVGAQNYLFKVSTVLFGCSGIHILMSCSVHFMSSMFVRL